jgi:hypothetical protein
MYSLLRKSVFVCLIVSLLISGAISTSHSSNKIKLEKEVGIVVPVAGVTDMPNEVTLRMYDSNTAATPLTSQTFLRGEYSAYYNIIKSDGLTEMNVVKFEIKFTNFDKFLDYLDIVKKTENFWIEVDFDGKLIGQREQLDRQTTNQILATVNAQTADTSDPSSAQSAAQTGSFSTSGTNYQSGSSLVKGTSQGSSQIGSSASTIMPNVVGGVKGQIQYNGGGGVQGNASQFYYDDINNRVGIGTAGPFSSLHVNRNYAGGSSPAASGTTDPTVASRIQYGAVALDTGILDSLVSFIQGRNTSNLAVNYKLSLNPNGGNVGIATATPFSSLHVYRNYDGGSIPASSGTTDPTVASRIQYGAVAVDTGILDSGASFIQGRNTTNLATNYSLLLNPNGGKVGIATVAPFSSLHVNRNYTGGSSPATSGTTDPTVASRVQYGAVALDTGILDSAVSFIQGRNTSDLAVNYNLSLNPTGGNVGIGTTSPCSDCRLAVNGKIRAKEIVVDTGWSDFVFYDNYALMPLQEVEKFIKENQHLPGIPTAADVEKDGISLGNINAKLLQKIEELTLYVIDLKKENDVLKGDFAVLQKQMERK